MIDQLLVGGAAALFVAGVAVALSGPRIADRPRAQGPSERPWFVVVAVVAALVVFAVSGWTVAALAAGALIGFAARAYQRRERVDPASAERVEALASWIENVRDVLRAGNQPIGAIGATVETCPVLIRQPVRQLFARLSAGQSSDLALRRFADDMDDPLADLVAVGLLIAVSRGAETEQVLSSLAEQARHQADRRRIVEAERAPMRREVQMVTVVMCALLGAVFLFARSAYLDAYDTASGQLFLSLILAGYAALLVWVGRLARFGRPARFLTMSGFDDGAAAAHLSSAAGASGHAPGHLNGRRTAPRSGR